MKEKCKDCNHLTALGYTCKRNGIPDTEKTCEEHVISERLETKTWGEIIKPIEDG